MEPTSPTKPVHAVVPEAPAAPARKKNRLPFYVLGGLIAAILLGIGVYALVTAGQEDTDDAQVEADVVPISARTGGLVLKVMVQENQSVKKGDVLLQIDEVDHAARLAQAQAELDTAKAQAAAAEAQEAVVSAAAKGGFSSAKAMVSGSSVQVQSAEAQIAAAKATLARAGAEAHKAELDLARARELRKADAIPQERLDNAEVANDAAQAALAQAKAQVAASDEAKRAAESRVAEARGRLDQSTPIDAQIETAHAQADLARARVKAAEAAVTLAANQLSYTKVTAPDDGVVSKLGVHEGQLVQPGQPVGELVPAKTYVVADFKETQIGEMHPGDRAEVEIDAFPGKKLEGVVESLSGGTGARFSLLPPDNASGNYVKVVQRVPVRVAWKAPPGLPLRAGLSADVTVYLGTGKAQVK